jgi:hypothetical protein
MEGKRTRSFTVVAEDHIDQRFHSTSGQMTPINCLQNVFNRGVVFCFKKLLHLQQNRCLAAEHYEGGKHLRWRVTFRSQTPKWRQSPHVAAGERLHAPRAAVHSNQRRRRLLGRWVPAKVLHKYREGRARRTPAPPAAVDRGATSLRTGRVSRQLPG